MEYKEIDTPETAIPSVHYETEEECSLEEVFDKLCAFRENFYGPLDLRTYPCKQIEVARHPKHGLTVVISCQGKELSITSHIVPETQKIVKHAKKANVSAAEAVLNQQSIIAAYYQQVVQQVKQIIQPARHLANPF